MEERFDSSADLSAGECLVIVGLVGMLFICALLAAVSLHYGRQIECAAYVRLTLYLAMIGLCLAALRATLTKEMSRTSYVLSETDFVKIRPNRIVSVPLADIRRFRYVRIPMLFNYGSLSVPGGNIAISFRTRDTDVLIGRLRDALAARGNAAAFPNKETAAYQWAARCTQQTNARVRPHLSHLVGLVMLVCTVNVMTAVFLWWLPFFLSFLWSVFTLLLFINSIRYAEYVLAFRQKRLAAAPASGDVTRAYLFVCGIAFVVYLACGMGVKTVFLRNL